MKDEQKKDANPIYNVSWLSKSETKHPNLLDLKIMQHYLLEQEFQKDTQGIILVGLNYLTNIASGSITCY